MNVPLETIPKGLAHLSQRLEPDNPLGTLGFEGLFRYWGTLVCEHSEFVSVSLGLRQPTFWKGGLLKINPRLEVQQALWG